MNNELFQSQDENDYLSVKSRIQVYEPKIIKFIEFLKKDFIEKEKQANLTKFYESKLREFGDDVKAEIHQNKKIFEEKFNEINNMQNALKVEFHLETQNNDYLNNLIKDAKNDIRLANFNKNEKSEIQEKLHLAKDQYKKLEEKLKNFIEILKRAINFLGIDKKKILEKDLSINTAKLEAGIPTLVIKYLKNIQLQAKIYRETADILISKGNPQFDIGLKHILNKIITFIDDIKKKTFELKGNKLNSELIFALNGLNTDTNESILKLEDFDFLHFQKSNDMLRASEMFISTLKQNTFLMTKILNLSELLYAQKLDKVFQTKLKKYDSLDDHSLYKSKFENIQRSDSSDKLNIDSSIFK